MRIDTPLCLAPRSGEEEKAKKKKNLEKVTHKVSATSAPCDEPLSTCNGIRCTRVWCVSGRQVFFDVQIGDKPAGRIVMGLFGKVRRDAPRTS